MKYDRKALKLEAKSLIRETRPRAWLVTLVFLLLAVLLPNLVSNLVNPVRQILPSVLDDLANMSKHGQTPDDLWLFTVTGQAVSGGVLMLFVSILLALYTIVMDFGYVAWAVRVFRRQRTGMGDLFSGFSVAGKAIGAQILSNIFLFLWMMLFYVVAILLTVAGLWLFESVMQVEALAVLWYCLVVVGYIIVGLFLACRYSLVPYYVMTDPGLGVMGSIRASVASMKGNYIKKIVLRLSFLGWYLLECLIVFAVVLLGWSLVLLVGGTDWLEALVRAAQTTANQADAAALMSGGLYQVLTHLLLPMGAVVAAAWLVTLPIDLWLRSYVKVSDAGFFLTVTGQAVLVEDGEAWTPPAPANDAPADDAPRCAKCGAVLAPGSAFCTQCGAPTAEPAPVVETPAEPVVETPEEPVVEAPTETPEEPVEDAPATDVSPVVTPEDKPEDPAE